MHGDKTGPLDQFNPPVTSDIEGPPVLEQPLSKPRVASPAPSVKSAVVESGPPPVTETPIPATEPPAAETPAAETPVLELPVIEPPVLEPPVIEPAAVATPVLEAPVLEPPVIEPPVLEPPVLEPVPALMTPGTPGEGTRPKRGQKRKVAFEDTGDSSVETGGATAKRDLAPKTRSQKADAAAHAVSSGVQGIPTRKLRSKK